MNTLEDKIYGCLLGGLIGDAMGAPTEGKTFRQISDQLLRVKRQAAVDQSLAGVLYAQTEVSGISTGDAASVRSALDRTVQGLRSRGGAAGDFDVVIVYRSGDDERPAWGPWTRDRGLSVPLPPDARGIYLLLVRARDAAGREGRVSARWPIVVDRHVVDPDAGDPGGVASRVSTFPLQI